ncbi:hypothetical protein H8356DRAFT_930100 [Neocallimastix lanati (nom. inval.)]|nr:hypothetical protein H8356DRAFT_930100 [Neocallimastix sp. JGI-2020a]
MKASGVLCLDIVSDGKTGTFASKDATDKYLLSYDIESLYASSIRGGQFGVLKATANKITLDTTVTGSVCVTNSNLKVTPKSGNCDASTTTEYTCTSGMCTLNTGCTGVNESTHCIDAGKKLYASVKNASCNADTSESSYLVFKCTNKDTCTLLDDDGIDDLIGTESLLVYYADANKVFTQKKDGFFYLNTTKSKLVYCPSENNGTIVCSSITPSEGYYLNAARDDLTGAIITCLGTPVKCKKGNGTADFSYIDAGKEGNIISCAGTTCTTAPGSKMQGHAYIDGTETTTPNIMITYDRSEGKFVSTTLDFVPKYYVDADDPEKIKNIITCNNAGCTSSHGSTLPGHAYISGTDPEKMTLISYEDTDSDGEEDAFDVADDQIKTDSYFIDGTNPKNLISCTVSGGCFSGAPPIPSGSVMLFKTDGVTAGNTITCTNEGCISSKGKKIIIN